MKDISQQSSPMINNGKDGFGKYTDLIYRSILTELSFLHYQSLLNMGCGIGKFLEMVPRRARLSIAGVDNSKANLEMARKRMGDRADLRLGEWHKIPWEEENFDIILCCHSFFTCNIPLLALQEMTRVLSPGGRVIIADPYCASPIRQIKNWLGTGNYYSETDYQELLGESDLTPVKWRTIENRACLVIAQKLKPV
ncbi:MAG: class I SAM-dependent methyltransferase [Chitinophagales bacterium]